MTGLARISALVTVALALTLAVAIVVVQHDREADAVAKIVLTGRTDQDKPFVTQIVNGDLTWFDTVVHARCGDADFFWNWLADDRGTTMAWTKTRLTASYSGQWENRAVELSFRARYATGDGLTGELRYRLDRCDSGWVPFWARADR